MSRLSLQEVSEIARLASQRRTVARGSGPTVDSVAHALGLPPEQVRSLLSEVRGYGDDPGYRDGAAQMRRNLIGLGVASLVFVLLLGWTLAGRSLGGRDEAPSARPAIADAARSLSGTPRTVASVGGGAIADRSTNVPGPSAGVAPSGGGTVRSAPSADYVHDPQHRLMNEADEAMRRWNRPVASSPQPLTPE